MNVSPVDLVLRVADGSIGASEVPAGTNAGPYVERCQAVTGNAKGAPWCASWVARIGVAALGKRWPLPKTGGCQVLHDFAKPRGILRDTPQTGDVFLIWHPELNRFAHTGFVALHRAGHRARTFEGNTSSAGVREGWIVADRERVFSAADRFIRWTDLVPQ